MAKSKKITKKWLILISLCLILLPPMGYLYYKFEEATNNQRRLSKAMSVLKYGQSNDGRIIDESLTPIAEAGNESAIYFLSFTLYCGANNLPRDTGRAIRLLQNCDSSACNDVMFLIKNRDPDKEPECLRLMEK